MSQQSQSQSQSQSQLYGGRTAAHSLNIVIVGCGLGGLAAAYALGRAGHSITLIEGAVAIGEVGAGIQVSPNVSRVLISFGLGERLNASAVEPMGIVFRRYATGELVGRTDWQNMEELYGAPYYHVHRADLHRMLYDIALELPNVKLRLATTVKAYPAPGTIVIGPSCRPGEAPSKHTETLTADLVIGADGVKSVLRAEVVGSPDAARATGDAAYRAIVPASKLLEHEDLREFIQYPHMCSWMGPRRHIMGYCMRSKQEYNIVLIHPDDGSVESWTAEGSADKMRDDFDDYEPRIKKLLSFVDSTLKWKLMDRQPLSTWIHSDGKLVLLGDACHPMLPYRAQGAAMAIEDGAVLGALLARLQTPEEVPTLLKAYLDLRHTRTAEVQASSRLNQHIFHLPDGPAQEERDDAMRQTLVGAPGGGYPPAVIAAQRAAAANPTSAAAVQHAAYEGNPNQWADVQKSRTLFGYDAERAVTEWLVEHGLETVPPSEAQVVVSRGVEEVVHQQHQHDEDDRHDALSSNGTRTLFDGDDALSEVGSDGAGLRKVRFVHAPIASVAML